MQLLAVPMASSGGGGGITLLLPLILIVGMIWFMSRTQKKQRQRQAETVAALQPGTKVITTSGLVGIVEETDDEYVTLEISDGVLVQVVKAAIGRVIPDDDTDNSIDEAADEAVTTDDTTDDTTDTSDAAKVDVPDAKSGEQAAGKVQDSPKLPPTHTEN
ncbi:preprotein translocase subunit YajC [Kribbella sp. NPDC048915]|uniref:preprotein translocase subunit YajC n=1 Tax=Kribbella sp. NPDC048915 TaxID=3155148 RepID=UPI0034052A6C